MHKNCFTFTVNVILKRCDFLFLHHCYASHMKYMRRNAQQAYAWNIWKHINVDEWTFVWEQRATNLKIWVGWWKKHAIITKLYFWFALVTIWVSKRFFKLCIILFATQVFQYNSSIWGFQTLHEVITFICHPSSTNITSNQVR